MASNDRVKRRRGRRRKKEEEEEEEKKKEVNEKRWVYRGIGGEDKR